MKLVGFKSRVVGDTKCVGRKGWISVSSSLGGRRYHTVIRRQEPREGRPVTEFIMMMMMIMIIRTIKIIMIMMKRLLR